MIKSTEEIKNIAKECISTEIDSIHQLYSRLDDTFVKVVTLVLGSKGRLIITAIGKSANIANKMVATFNSTGQPSVFLHAADAIHGDLGNIQNGDIVLCISKSGNTPEIKALIPLIKKMNNVLIAMTGNMQSYLSKESDLVLDISVEKEACPNNLAPTSSTTVQLVMGDALAVSLLACKNFTEQDFARFHPGGTLGKRLSIKLSDLLNKNSNPQVELNSTINDVIFEISNKRLGATAVLDDGVLKGIITDGDLRRMLEKEPDINKLYAKDIMSKNPKTINIDSLAYEALNYMQKHNINQLIVFNKQDYVGIIHIHEIINEGIV